MKKKIIFAVFCILLFVPAFVMGINNLRQYKPMTLFREQNSEGNAYMNRKITIKVEDYGYGALEPSKGLYLGAYVASNPYINYDDQVFDTLTHQTHEVTMTYIKAGGEVDMHFMLKAMEFGKIPYIVISPDQELFDEEAFEKTITSISRYEYPVFIDLYPITEEMENRSESYISFYRKAYNMCKDKLNESACVWSIPWNYDYQEDSLYPGDDYVDWIGFKVRMESNEVEQVYTALNALYEHYQTKAPLAISELGINWYEQETHSYKVEEARLSLEKIYSIVNKRRRIKMVNLLNVNVQGREDFPYIYSVTEDESMLNCYKSAIAGRHSASNSDDLVSNDAEFDFITPTIQVDEALYIGEGACLSYLINSGSIPKTFLDYHDKRYYLLDEILLNNNLIHFYN